MPGEFAMRFADLSNGTCVIFYENALAGWHRPAEVEFPDAAYVKHGDYAVALDGSQIIVVTEFNLVMPVPMPTSVPPLSRQWARSRLQYAALQRLATSPAQPMPFEVLWSGISLRSRLRPQSQAGFTRVLRQLEADGLIRYIPGAGYNITGLGLIRFHHPRSTS